MAAHSRPSKIVSRTKQSSRPYKTAILSTLGKRTIHPAKIAVQPSNSTVRWVLLYAPSIERYHPLCDELFLCLADSFDNSLKRERKSGGCDVVPDLSRSESAVTQQNVRKS